MRFLKSILAVYVSLYLILPGCLCQILTVFGCGSAIHAGAPIGHLLEFAPLDESLAMSCHCDEHVDKSTELPFPESFDTSSLELEGHIINAPVFKLAEFNVGYSAGSRAPPGGSFWTLTSHSGVFLI